MSYLKDFVKEYQQYIVNETVFDESIKGEIQRIQKLLLDDALLPSIPLKIFFEKLLRRSQYPMEVAIVGQFSSGKSTFLNALLAKDILPTGITPVTSKVNYINYGKSYRLKVTYNNGAHEYHALEEIASFTDQRHALKDVKYLTLYAPMEILKELSFVDTPGLNSQSVSDTQVTKKILRDVDGIIWLTLFDNAGKESETKILNEYLDSFEGKALCVVNQKDKFSHEQISTTMNYLKENFANYFKKVVPISAKQALESRAHQKEVLIESAVHELETKFKNKINHNVDAKALSFFDADFEGFVEKIQTIKDSDRFDDHKLLQSSNISQVLDFIENDIRPKADQAKSFALRKDLQGACEILIKEYETILAVYESLETILRHKEEEVLAAFDSVYVKHAKELYEILEEIENIFQTLTESFYQNIKSKQAFRYVTSKSFFGRERIKKYAYESLYIDKESILQKLFYEDQFIDKQIKAVVARFKTVELQSSEDFRDVFRILKSAIQSWQEPYELIKKQREIASDREFANTRQFVAKIYENVLLAFHRLILGNIQALHKQFAFFSAAMSFSYRQITQESLAQLEEKLQRQIMLYEKDPLKHSLHIIDKSTITEILQSNFNFEKIERFLTSRRNYLYKIVERSKVQYSEATVDRIDYVMIEKQKIHQKIKTIQEAQALIKA